MNRLLCELGLFVYCIWSSLSIWFDVLSDKRFDMPTDLDKELQTRTTLLFVATWLIAIMSLCLLNMPYWFATLYIH
ncbi:hypothetical protein BLOT_008925 [Blomia tropicalis]|nr:hypothetical protein BLOT_008925 [Blomia tropicalis]